MRILALFILSMSVNVIAQEFIPLNPDLTSDYEPIGELEQGLWMAMDKFEKELSKSEIRITDEELNRYLNDMVCRLAPDYCSDIRVYISRVPYFNAFMGPNGMMNVWSGLLLRVENESQLATVIGHEIGHYLRRHGVDRYKSATEKMSFGAFLSLGLAVGVAAAGGGNAGVYAGDAANLMLVSSIYAHSRKHEHEADQYGVQLMADAGYDYHEASKIWQFVIDEEAAAENKKTKAIPFFVTHPSPEDRIEQLNKHASALDTKKNSEIGQPDEFVKIIAPYWKDFLGDEIKLNQPGRSLHLLNSLSKSSEYSGTIHYYRGEVYRLRKEEGDIERAINSYEASLQFEDTPAEAFRSLGLLLFKKKNFAEANKNFHAYLEIKPDAKDKEMIEYYLSIGG